MYLLSASSPGHPRPTHKCLCHVCTMQSLAGPTVDNGAGAKVLTEQVYIQSCTGEDQFQFGDLLKHIPHFSEQKVSQAVAFMHLILFEQHKLL